MLFTAGSCPGRLLARRPDLDLGAFKDRVSAIFHKLQEAWSEQRWELARPYETDALFQVHRFWMERYRRHGLVNRLEDKNGNGITFRVWPAGA